VLQACQGRTLLASPSASGIMPLKMQYQLANTFIHCFAGPCLACQPHGNNSIWHREEVLRSWAVPAPVKAGMLQFLLDSHDDIVSEAGRREDAVTQVATATQDTTNLAEDLAPEYSDCEDIADVFNDPAEAEAPIAFNDTWSIQSGEEGVTELDSEREYTAELDDLDLQPGGQEDLLQLALTKQFQRQQASQQFEDSQDSSTAIAQSQTQYSGTTLQASFVYGISSPVRSSGRITRPSGKLLASVGDLEPHYTQRKRRRNTNIST
jgi:hypothetical protein